MSRWHLKSCTEPDVVVHNCVPSCRACKASPDLERLIDQQKRLESESGQPWTVPEDEPIGEMNLFWPECVPYAGRQDQEATDHDEQQGVNKSQSAESSQAQHASAEQSSSQGIGSPSVVYERPLSDNEFRLVCLSTANHYPGVVHITLETYSNDDCPEYETVSYAWGGEDENSDQRHPVFVGEYWDVMLHTKNCWSLLAYLQPRRGIRLVWIDSLSINQRDNKEKVVQVGSMGERYRNCTRVVVYLGPDYAVPAATGPHPRRVPFHEMPDETFQRLSRARYLRRIWIVQELILAPSAIIPLDGTDYVVGGDTVAAHLRMGQDPRLDASEFPWISQVTTGGMIQYQAQSTQLLSAIQLTLGSESSDPRDRIFGILGLIRADTFSAASYDISTVHVAIGVFSHLLLNLKHIGVLLGASSPRNTEMGYPSWLPDWKSSITVAETKYPDAHRLSLSQALQDLAHDFLDDTSGSHRSARMSDRMTAIQVLLGSSEPHWNSLTPSYFCCQLDCHLHQVVRVVINAYDDEWRWDPRAFTFDYEQRGLFTEFHREWWDSSHDGAAIPWDEGAYIKSSTGALSMHLTHLLHFTTQPEVIMSHPDICLLRIRPDASSHTSNLFLGTLPNTNADFFNLGAGSKDLFILPGTENRPSLILFMKLHTGDSDFKLLACCYCVDLFFMTSDPSERMEPRPSYTENSMASLHHKMQVVHKALENIEKIKKPWPRDYSKVNKDKLVRPPVYKVGSEELSYTPLFLKEEWSAWDVLFVVQGLANQQDGKPGSFFARYSQHLSKWGKGHNPRLAEGYLEVTVNLRKCIICKIESDDKRTVPYEYSLRYEWEIEIETGTWVKAIYAEGQVGRDSNARVRVPIRALEDFLSNSVYYWMLRQFTPYSRKTGVDEYDIIRGGPKEEYRSIFPIEFPENIREAFNVDMWTRMVTIV